MNKDNLKSIIKNYIDKFHFLNVENNEIYKWEIAQEFQSFDLDTEDFTEMLKRMRKATQNLIESSHDLPFSALVEYAKRGDAETVREMFKKLFAAGELDNAAKQKAITEFIKESEALKEKYFGGGNLYSNSQRSVMMYLFLRYPNSNYAYKAEQAKKFADCIEFYEDWGPMTDFNLGIYSKMCDLLVEELKQNDALMKTHLSRFENHEKPLHPDDNLHILALDIIYCSQRYDLYGGITFDPINAKERKLYFENVTKAKELFEKTVIAEKDKIMLSEAKEYISKNVKKGDHIIYKIFGKSREGIIDSIEGTRITVLFPEPKLLSLANAKSNIIFDSKEVTDKLAEYAPVISREKEIPEKYEKAKKALEPYVKFLD